MNRPSKEHVEEMLRSAAQRARRDPPSALRGHVMTAIASEASAPIAEPFDRPVWRERRQNVFVAASVLVAVGLWVAAFLGVAHVGVHPPISSDATAQNVRPDPLSAGLSAIQSSPATLSSALDDSLFGELDDIAQDATRAARFLVGRLPSSLAR